VLSGPLLSFGAYSIYSFGILLAAIFILGAFLFWRSAHREGFASDTIFDLIFLSSFVALLAGRLTFLLFLGGGGSLTALVRVGDGIFWAPAFLAGLLSFYLYTRRREEWSFSKLADLAVPVLALGQGLVLLAAEATSYLSSVALAGFGYLGLFILLVLAKRRLAAVGTTFTAYLVGSGALTVFYEWQRAEKTIVYLPVWAGGVDLNYLLGSFLVLFGVLRLLYLFARARGIPRLLQRRVAIPALLGRARQSARQVEKQLRFKLKVRKEAVRSWKPSLRWRDKNGNSEEKSSSN